jgi:3-deoxy-manno-octulosonate cytidylyltransferase (CMP-KDO synthetase)
VIPARLSSTRLTRKVLREIAGRPMVEWVWRAAAASGLMDPVVVATDSERGGRRLPGARHPVRNDLAGVRQRVGSRVREVARQIDAEIYVNIQGDEPMLTPELFPPMLDACLSGPRSRSPHCRPLLAARSSQIPTPSRW